MNYSTCEFRSILCTVEKFFNLDRPRVGMKISHFIQTTLANVTVRFGKFATQAQSYKSTVKLVFGL